MKSTIALLAVLLYGLLLAVGCTDQNESPTASFTISPSSGEAPLSVSFDASNSYDPDGSIASYGWDFGDGASDSGEATSHTYNESGNYTARLTTTDNEGSSDSTTQVIQVNQLPNEPPSASFVASPTSGTAPLEVNFDAAYSSDLDGSITSYNWDFGDTSSGFGITVTHTYTAAGTYVAQLTVADDSGASDTALLTIQVSASPPPADDTPAPHTANCQIGVSYTAADGLTVTLNSLVITEKAASYEYAINYTLANNTSNQSIDEGTFKMYYADEAGGLPQYGFFSELFPGDTTTRTYTFEELKDKPFDLLQYHDDHFFSDNPLEESLRWAVNP